MSIHVGDVVRVAPQWLYKGRSQIVNVWSVLIGPGLASTDVLVREDIDEWLTGLYGTVTGSMDNSNVHVATGLFNQSLSTPEIGIGRNSSLDGATGGDSMPVMSAPFVWYRTGVSRVIGKKFLPPFPEGQWDGEAWGSTAQGRLQDFANALITSFGGAHGTDLHVVVWRRGSHTYEDLLDSNYSPYARTQRRRRPGVGA